jgi:hypothetical protein
VYHLTIANERALTGLDGLQQGFLLVDAGARPLFVNRAARALLDNRDGLRLEAGALSASDADGGRALRGLITSCAADASVVTGSGGDIALPRVARPNSCGCFCRSERKQAGASPPEPRPQEEGGHFCPP